MDSWSHATPATSLLQAIWLLLINVIFKENLTWNWVWDMIDKQRLIISLFHFHVLSVFIEFTSRVGLFSTPPPNLIWQALFLFSLADGTVKLVFTREDVCEQQGQPQWSQAPASRWCVCVFVCGFPVLKSEPRALCKASLLQLSSAIFSQKPYLIYSNYTAYFHTIVKI